MSKKDGTYVGGETTVSRYKSIFLKPFKGTEKPKDFSIQIDLDPGSGSATCSLHGSIDSDYSSSSDITEVLTGQETLSTDSGVNKRFTVIDDTGILRNGYNYLWLKIVLDTSGADDSDFTTKTIYANR